MWSEKNFKWQTVRPKGNQVPLVETIAKNQKQFCVNNTWSSLRTLIEALHAVQPDGYHNIVGNQIIFSSHQTTPTPTTNYLTRNNIIGWGILISYLFVYGDSEEKVTVFWCTLQDHIYRIGRFTYKDLYG